MHFYLLWGLFGWSLSSWAMMRIFWLPDPPPDWMGRYIVVNLAGIIGGMGGGALVSRIVLDSTPRVSIIGAFAGSMVLVGILRGVFGARSAS
ncbi:MAG TPA: hypothetical protein VLX90_14210 [Steroidobacteraceae bacterium]|nr:hypothetical protein [Steroidobacteraceae bacterium]